MAKWELTLQYPIGLIVGEGLLSDKTVNGYRFKTEVVELPVTDRTKLMGKRIQWQYEQHMSYQTWTIIEAKRVE